MPGYAHPLTKHILDSRDIFSSCPRSRARGRAKGKRAAHRRSCSTRRGKSQIICSHLIDQSDHDRDDQTGVAPSPHHIPAFLPRPPRTPHARYADRPVHLGRRAQRNSIGWRRSTRSSSARTRRGDRERVLERCGQLGWYRLCAAFTLYQISC